LRGVGTRHSECCRLPRAGVHLHQLVTMPHDLLILGWHNVEGTWCFPSNPGQGSRGLAAQLRWVRRLGHVVDLGEALATLNDGGSLPARSVALTFDDGYRDNLSIAEPLLRQLGIPATFFLVPSFLSDATSPWWEALAFAIQTTTRPSLSWEGGLYSLLGAGRRSAIETVSVRLKRLDQARRDTAVAAIVEQLEPERHADLARLFLDWDDARDLARRGAAIGSHSLDHAILANETPSVQHKNLAGARRQLEDELQAPVDLLAYPNGTADDFDMTTEEAARDVGYRCGVTTIPGWNSASTPPYQLRRYVLSPERGELAFKSIAKHAVARSFAPNPARRR
jgi:peptidoglycan/xylan/chitin deacetylase (PgdA/CDA1 family)